MHPYNFLQFCMVGEKYSFIESNPKIEKGDTVINKEGTEMKLWKIEGDKYVVGALEESCYATDRQNLKLIK